MNVDDRRYDLATDREAALDAAADAVARGEAIVLPTDTVYGIAVDPFDPAAIAKLFEAKQRGRDLPPPILIAEKEMAQTFSSQNDTRVTALADAFWPGPLTIIVTARDSLRLDIGDRGQTLALRIPDHEDARELLRRTGPLAVSSANVTSQSPALTIDEAMTQLGESVAVYVDGGAMPGPTPSTIVDVSGAETIVLRVGMLTVEQIQEAVPGAELPPEPVAPAQPDESSPQA